MNNKFSHEQNGIGTIKVSLILPKTLEISSDKHGLLLLCQIIVQEMLPHIDNGNPNDNNLQSYMHKKKSIKFSEDSIDFDICKVSDDNSPLPHIKGKTFAQYGFDIPNEMGNYSEELLETNAYISATAWHEAYIRISEGQEIPVENVVAGIGANEAGLRTLSKFIMLVANGFTNSVRLKPRAVDNLQGELTQESMDLVIARN